MAALPISASNVLGGHHLIRLAKVRPRNVSCPAPASELYQSARRWCRAQGNISIGRAFSSSCSLFSIPCSHSIIMARLTWLCFVTFAAAARRTHRDLHQSLVRQVDSTSIPSYAIDYGMLGVPQVVVSLTDLVQSTARMASLDRDILPIRYRGSARSHSTRDQLFCDQWN